MAHDTSVFPFKSVSGPEQSTNPLPLLGGWAGIAMLSEEGWKWAVNYITKPPGTDSCRFGGGEIIFWVGYGLCCIYRYRILESTQVFRSARNIVWSQRYQRIDQKSWSFCKAKPVTILKYQLFRTSVSF